MGPGDITAVRAGSRTGPIVALVVVQILFGFHYLAAKLLVEVIPPPAWALVRASAAAVILLGIARFRGAPLPRGRVLASLALLGLFGVTINQYLFVEGIHRTTPGHSALINTSIPVGVLLISVLLGRERPTLRRLTGIAVTIAGVVVLTGPERMDWSLPSFRGDLLTLGNAMSYSLFLVLGKPVLERQRTLPATAVLLSFGALWLVPVGGPALASLRPTDFSAAVWGLALFIVIGPTIVAYLLNNYALRRVESSMVAFFIYLQPLIGAGISIAAGVERPTARLLGAAAVVFTGIYITLRAAPPAGDAASIQSRVRSHQSASPR